FCRNARSGSHHPARPSREASPVKVVLLPLVSPEELIAMNSIAHAVGTTASPTGARVTSIEEGRAEHDQGYFFRMPDWLAEALCAHHASGAAWALVTLVGRKTRWGAQAPQRITLQEMLEATHYSRQALVDALAALASWGVLYVEREPKGKWV